MLMLGQSDSPIHWTGVILVLLSLSGFGFGVLGYRLYRLGVHRTVDRIRGGECLTLKSELGSIMISGGGPGMFFVVAGAVVLSLLAANTRGDAGARVLGTRIAALQSANRVLLEKVTELTATTEALRDTAVFAPKPFNVTLLAPSPDSPSPFNWFRINPQPDDVNDDLIPKTPS